MTLHRTTTRATRLQFRMPASADVIGEQSDMPKIWQNVNMTIALGGEWYFASQIGC